MPQGPSSQHGSYRTTLLLTRRSGKISLILWQNSTNLLYSTIVASAATTTASINQHTTSQFALSYLHEAEATYESAKVFMAEEYLPARKTTARKSQLYAVFTGSDAEYSLAEAIQVHVFSVNL